MVSRRVVILGAAGTVAAGVGATAALGRLDDTLRAVGARPTPSPTDDDVKLAAVARAEADVLVERAEAEQAPGAVLAVLRDQADDLPPTHRTVTVDGDTLLDACRAVAASRADACVTAVSADLAVVLGSSSAGLHQIVRQLEAAAS